MELANHLIARPISTESILRDDQNSQLFKLV